MVLFGLHWYILSKMMMISEEFLVQNLSLQKSDVDKYISPSCVKLESKLMAQNKIESSTKLGSVLMVVDGIKIWVFLLRISYSRLKRAWRCDSAWVWWTLNNRDSNGGGAQIDQVFECPRDPLLFQSWDYPEIRLFWRRRQSAWRKVRGSTSEEGAVLVFKVTMMSAVEFSPPNPRARDVRSFSPRNITSER